MRTVLKVVAVMAAGAGIAALIKRLTSHKEETFITEVKPESQVKAA